MKQIIYIVIDREAGNYIACENTRDKADDLVSEFENQDMIDGVYTPNFYEVIERELNHGGVYPAIKKEEE